MFVCIPLKTVKIRKTVNHIVGYIVLIYETPNVRIIKDRAVSLIEWWTVQNLLILPDTIYLILYIIQY